MPSPDSDGWSGWARHWVSATVSPLWLSQAAAQTRLPLAVQARLAWRLRAAEAASLERAADTGGALRQSLRDADVSGEVLDQVLEAVNADLGRRRRTLAELAVVGRHL